MRLIVKNAPDLSRLTYGNLQGSPCKLTPRCVRASFMTALFFRAPQNSILFNLSEEPEGAWRLTHG